MKILLSALAAVMVIGAVATATPAQARCWSNGWQCAQRFHYGYNPWRYGHRNWGYNRGGYYGGGYNGGWRNGGGYNR